MTLNKDEKIKVKPSFSRCRYTVYQSYVASSNGLLAYIPSSEDKKAPISNLESCTLEFDQEVLVRFRNFIISMLAYVWSGGRLRLRLVLLSLGSTLSFRCDAV